MDDEPKTMQEEIDADAGERDLKPFDIKKALKNTQHKITDYSPNAHKYIRQRRIQLQVKIGREIIERLPITSYQKIVHRDQYDTTDSDNRKLLVDSDETVVIIVARVHDAKNTTGRSLRLGGATPIATLDQTLSSVADLGKLSLSDDPKEGSENDSSD